MSFNYRRIHAGCSEAVEHMFVHRSRTEGCCGSGPSAGRFEMQSETRVRAGRRHNRTVCSVRSQGDLTVQD